MDSDEEFYNNLQLCIGHDSKTLIKDIKKEKIQFVLEWSNCEFFEIQRSDIQELIFSRNYNKYTIPNLYLESCEIEELYVDCFEGVELVDCTIDKFTCFHMSEHVSIQKEYEESELIKKNYSSHLKLLYSEINLLEISCWTYIIRFEETIIDCVVFNCRCGYPEDHFPLSLESIAPKYIIRSDCIFHLSDLHIEINIGSVNEIVLDLPKCTTNLIGKPSNVEYLKKTVSLLIDGIKIENMSSYKLRKETRLYKQYVLNCDTLDTICI